MGAKVTQKEMIAEIVRNRDRDLRIALEEGRTMMPYSYADFRKDMRSSDLVVDRDTIRDKWSLLVDKGTFIESGRWTRRKDDVRAVIVLYRISDQLSPTYRGMLRSNQESRAKLDTTCGERETPADIVKPESLQPAGRERDTPTEVGA